MTAIDICTARINLEKVMDEYIKLGTALETSRVVSLIDLVTDLMLERRIIAAHQRESAADAIYDVLYNDVELEG